MKVPGLNILTFINFASIINFIVKIKEMFTCVVICLSDIEVQLQYTSLNVTEENTTIALCAIITAGAVERNVTVVMSTSPITGKPVDLKRQEDVSITIFLQQLMAETMLEVYSMSRLHLGSQRPEITLSVLI